MGTPVYKVDPQLYQYTTVRQLEMLEAIDKHKSIRKAARELKLNFGTVYGALKQVERKASLIAGYSPKHDLIKPIAPGFRAKGHTTLYDMRLPGAPAIMQYVKTERDAEAQEAMLRQFVEELCQEVKGLAPKVNAPKLADSDLLTVYPIGDQHHGMYADPAEAGDAYDTKISTTRLEAAFDHLLALAPASADGLLINLGDFLHGNDSTNLTQSGNQLDVDTRYGKVLYSGAMTLVRCVLKMLAKHQRVFVWNVRGNHDRDASLGIALAMSFYFHNEPRVIVDTGTSLYKYHRFGKVLIGSHHGHGAKPQDLPLIMAEDRKADWGVTDHRVWHCGHIHHLTRRDFVGCTVETHRTLASTDAWHAGQGYRSKKDMHAIVYHRDFGEVQRTRFGMEMVEAA